MVARWRRQLGMAGGGLALVLATSGCTGGTSDPGGANSGSAGPSDSASSSPTASATPRTTLTPAQQLAFEQATEVVLAYRQTITDLYSGARTDLNDLDDVATGELLDQGLRNISISLGEGWRSEPRGAEVLLFSSELQTVHPRSEPRTVVIRACIDTTGVVDVSPEGKRTPGIRENLDYTVTRTAHLPGPGWAVSQVTSERAKGARAC